MQSSELFSTVCVPIFGGILVFAATFTGIVELRVLLGRLNRGQALWTGPIPLYAPTRAQLLPAVGMLVIGAIPLLLTCQPIYPSAIKQLAAFRGSVVVIPVLCEVVGLVIGLRVKRRPALRANTRHQPPADSDKTM
jgi:hypothetical protein